MIKKTLHPKISYQKPTRDNNKKYVCSTCLSFFCHVSTIEKRTLHNICIEVNFNFFLLATHWWSFCCEMHQILQTRNNILRTFQLFRYWRSFFWSIIKLHKVLPFCLCHASFSPCLWAFPVSKARKSKSDQCRISGRPCHPRCKTITKLHHNMAGCN